MPAFHDQSPDDDPSIWISHRAEALLAMADEKLMQQHLSCFRTLGELDAARNELQNAAVQGMALIHKDRVVHGQLLGWPIMLQPQEPMSWPQVCGIHRDPAQPDIHDRLMAAWRKLTWITPLDICRRLVVLPGLIDAELAFDGHPLPMHRAINHAANCVMGVQDRKVGKLYGSPPIAVRTARRPFVLLMPAVVFGMEKHPLPMLAATQRDCESMGELVGGFFSSGPRFRQVLVHRPLPWRAAVRVAQDVQLLMANTHGLSHGWLTSQTENAQVCAPWEQVRYGVHYLRESQEGEPQVEQEAWNYPAWWQPSNHLNLRPPNDPLGWVPIRLPPEGGSRRTH